MSRKIATRVTAALAVAALLAGCTPAADRASKNLSKGADNFEVERRIVFFNGITDKYLLTIEGLCSIEPDGGKLDVTCKTGEGEYKKHFLGLSDNVSYFVEQIEGEYADPFRYRVIFRPESVIPAPELQTSNSN